MNPDKRISLVSMVVVHVVKTISNRPDKYCDSLLTYLVALPRVKKKYLF